MFLTRRLESCRARELFASERKTDSRAKPIHEIDETRREDASIPSALSAVVSGVIRPLPASKHLAWKAK